LAHQVFVSYATEDAEAASRLCSLLEAEGVGCWLASRDISEDSDRAAAILEAIRDSSLVLLLFSARANTSPTVLRDIERAIGYERPVLSIHLDDAVPNPSLEYYLNMWQWLDASAGVEAKRDDIVAAVREQLEGEAYTQADAPAWRWLDAAQGVDSRRQDIVAEVRGRLAQRSGSPTSPEAGAVAAAARGRTGRRNWGIALGVALVAVALGLALGLGLARGSDQGTWIKLHPAGTPPPARLVHAMVYEPSLGRLIMTGGCNADNSKYFADTWAYDPSARAWTDLNPAGPVPAGGTGQTLVYDPSTQKVILFGGKGETGPSNETWTYTPGTNSWDKLDPSGGTPSPRSAHSMVYDSVTRRLIMFGGWNETTCFNDTWAYDPVQNEWTRIDVEGPKPDTRWGHAAAYDETTGRVIIFGGWNETTCFNDTWAYDPVAHTWEQLQPSGDQPVPRVGASMVYNPSDYMLVMFGGSNADESKFFNETWTYDPADNSWSELKPAGAIPGGRFFSPLVYLPATGQDVMFGGGAGTLFDDTWAFTP
jgi:N-acetylneuraminic acid mutarotase